MITDETYGRWKSLVPFVYDWFAHTRTSWPSLSARWGEVLDANAYRSRQRVYVTEQTEGGDGRTGKPMPNTILVCQAEVLRPRVAAAEHMIFDEHSKSPALRKEKALWHPGEVNRMRCVPGRENVLMTHTDAPEVFVFDASGPGGKQNSLKRADGTQYTPPAMCLRGHKENAEYALAISQKGEVVASGGKDGMVMIWELADANKGGGKKEDGGVGAPVVGGGLSSTELARHTCVWARCELAGHTDTIEDVCFNPQNEKELCSVGDDRAMFFWDTRTKKATGFANGAHSDDVHCVGWSAHDEHVVVTGGKDTVVKVWDRRVLTNGSNEAMHTFDTHTDSVLCVDMHPHAKGVFMTADEVGRVNVFDYTKVGAEQTPELAKAGAPYLVLQHSGHRGTVWDIQWNPYDPWTVCSTSVGDFQNTLQLWRVNDMIYRDTEECIRELEEHRDIICGRQAPLKSKNPAQENKEDSEGAAEKDDASGADADDAMEE
jgi:histone-binding protein RBBP4